MIARAITYFGEPLILVCDGKCDKAWGINNRPRVQLSDDEDDYEFLADHELGDAPFDPGTYEGGWGKPDDDKARLNKWCARECERSVRASPSMDFDLPNYDERFPNFYKED